MKNIPLYSAIGLVAISLAAHAARAEDLSTVTALLPPGTFTTSAHSDEWKIAHALSAAPATVAEHASVVARSNSIISPGLTLREKALRLGHNPLDVEHERTGLENFQHLG